MAAWTGFWPLLLLLASPATARAQDRPPIIDMHLHALAADDQGPPPVGLCTPFPEFRSWDQRTPLGEQFLTLLKNPPCDDPVWSPATNEALMRETIAVMDRLNIVGVLTARPSASRHGGAPPPIASCRAPISGSSPNIRRSACGPFIGRGTWPCSPK
jgi:hypothetical protein